MSWSGPGEHTVEKRVGRRTPTNHVPSIASVSRIAEAGSGMKSRITAVFVGLAIVVIVLGVGVLVWAPPLGQAGDGGRLVVEWVSETERSIASNHHSPAAARVGDIGVVFAPISGVAHHHGDGTATRHAHASSGCALVTLDGSDGSVRWAYRVPATNCTVHAVADPTVGDIDDDGRVEVLAATTQDALLAFEALTGNVTFRYKLSSYGYSRPIVANVTGDVGPEIVVVDVRGSVFVVQPDGSTVWQDRHASYTWGQPRLGDLDGGGDKELFVALGNGTMIVYKAGTGAVVWRRPVVVEASITWTAVGDTDGDAAQEVIVATVGGDVRAYDGRTGDREWSRDIGRFAAVHAVGDGDGDGTTEVYAVAIDGVLRSLAGPTGAVEWSTDITAGPVQMMPPPVLGDVTGDGDPELVAVTNNGRVLVVEPGTGAVLAAYDRGTQIRTQAELADIDGDEAVEIIVMYGNGRVVALEYHPGTSRG